MAMKSPGPRIYAVLCAGLFACSLASAQQVTISRDSNLQAEPKADASVVGKVTKGTSAEVTAKQGAWVQVKSAEGTGWLFSFNVSYGSGGPAVAEKSPARRPSQSTIGIRGLEEEDLKAAKFDGKQLDALDTFATGKDDAEPTARGSGSKGQKK